jgi:hypothetical protein
MKIICGLAVMSLLTWGQDAVPKVVLKVIPLKYASPSAIYKVVSAFQPTALQYDDSLHVISVRGTADMVAAIEEAVKKLDVLPADFELTVYLISSSPQTGDLLPDALAATAKQLHVVFAYKGYQLIDSFVLRGRDGQSGSADGTIKSSTYSFRYNRATVMEGPPKMVNLQNLSLQIRMPSGARNEKGQPEFKTTGLSTDIDIRDGQKVVVGKSDVNNGESPLILVVTAKVVE